MTSASHPSPPSKRQSTGRTVAAVVLVAIAFALVWRFDTQIYEALRAPDETREETFKRAWYQFLRTIGYLPLWIALGLALLAERVSRRGTGRWAGFFIGLVPALAAGISEIIQNIVGRLKPNLTGGVHRYHATPDIPDISFGFPSSHAAVAFGGAFMLWMYFPRAGLVALALAVACAWTRILQGGHFASDVFASALVGYACARLVSGRRP